MNKPFFSMIVPMHNSSAFMRKCLDSIKAQTFTDYELIIVCDACEDNTAEIAREYTDKVFEIDAHRCGLARNKGLDEATGEWILFSDDDDWWLHEFAFEMIANRIEMPRIVDVDIVAFGFLTRNLTSQGFNECYNTRERIWPAIWNKAYNRAFIGDRRFPDWKVADDMGFTREVIPGAAIDYWPVPLYYYDYMRKGSLTWRDQQGEFKE